MSSLGTVASQEISGVLNSWVGRPSQAWTTIFRASEHNFQAGAFHQQCDGALPTIVIIKSDTGWTNNNNNTITMTITITIRPSHFTTLSQDTSGAASLTCPGPPPLLARAAMWPRTTPSSSASTAPAVSTSGSSTSRRRCSPSPITQTVDRYLEPERTFSYRIIATK